MQQTQLDIHLHIPYPAVHAEGPNMQYARIMLDNIGGGNSEMSSVSLYMYNSLVAPEPAVAAVFREIQTVEQRHLEIFNQLAIQLGENPRLWTQRGRRKVYWTPGYNVYSRNLPVILTDAIESEQAAIRKYEYQAGMILDRNIVENLRRIIQDEKRHAEIFQELHRQYCDNA